MATDQTAEIPTTSASTEDLAALDLPTALLGADFAEDYALHRILSNASDEAGASGNLAAQRGYRLLSVLCTLHLRVEDPGDVWGPLFQSPAGRSHIASDFRGEQNTVLADFVATISHPALRARVADVVWYNDRSLSKVASVAISSYCEVIERRLDGRFRRNLSDSEGSLVDLVPWLHRALQIDHLSRKREDSEKPERLSRVFVALYERAESTAQYVAYERVARLGLQYELLDWAKVSSGAEQLGLQQQNGQYPLAVQAVWNLAARAYAKLGDDEAKRRCQEQSINETLRMRDEVDSAAAKAFWTRKAIIELRETGQFKDRVDLLRKELRIFQDASLDDFHTVSVNIDVTKDRQGTIEIFEGLTLPDILLQSALICESPPVVELQEHALQARDSSIVSSLFGVTYIDGEGKSVAQTGASMKAEEHDADWLNVHSFQYLDLRRCQLVGGTIDPILRTTMRRFPLEERHFGPIVSMSPFVPPTHEHLFALGFARFWQGDSASAAHLLIPQLENSLRHVLLNKNRDSSKIKPTLLQEDRSLSGLLQRLRGELEEIFGVDLINEVDLLFSHHAGPALRHEVAHGKLSANACYHPTTIYACWLIYRLTCLPLVNYWKSRVAPEIEQAAF